MKELGHPIWNRQESGRICWRVFPRVRIICGIPRVEMVNLYSGGEPDIGLFSSNFRRGNRPGRFNPILDRQRGHFIGATGCSLLRNFLGSRHSQRILKSWEIAVQQYVNLAMLFHVRSENSWGWKLGGNCSTSRRYDDVFT